MEALKEEHALRMNAENRTKGIAKLYDGLREFVDGCRKEPSHDEISNDVSMNYGNLGDEDDDDMEV
jgi:hypothetical protein